MTANESVRTPLFQFVPGKRQGRGKGEQAVVLPWSSRVPKAAQPSPCAGVLVGGEAA